MSSRPTRARRAARRSAIFVDYANLHACLTERLDEPEHAGPHIAEAIGELRRYLADEDGAAHVLAATYGDFGTLDDAAEASLQRTLYQQGVESRFVPASAPGATLEMQLALDAVALLHRRPDMETVAVVTGNRTYLPLVQALRRKGAHAFVAALDPPAPGDFAHQDSDLFMSFPNLLSDAARRALLQNDESPARHATDRSPTPTSASDAPDPQYDRLDDDMLVNTLEVAEEYFGQYDEVYLTPLLRKLSDVLGERFDPKALVSDLEDAGAVRLEKRRGYPYDYTVLIVNCDHPDVREMEEAFYDGERSDYERGGASASGYEGDYQSDREPGYESDNDFEDDYEPSYEDDEDRYAADDDNDAAGPERD
jgi:hypothetical protein